jgi:small subunit ribosomal protein S4e
MANKGGRNKLKRISSNGPRHILKKENTFLVKPAPGSIKKNKGVSLAVVLRDMLKIAIDLREVKKILMTKTVLVNGKRAKDYKLPVGLFDVLDLVDIKKKYSFIPNKHRFLDIIEIDYKKPNLKLCKIINKTVNKGRKTTLSLDNGYNIIIGKGKYKTNDAVAFDFENKKIKEHYEFSEGVRVIFTEGTHIGEVGNVKSIVFGDETRKAEIVVKTKKKEVRSLLEYVYLLPDEFDYLLQ